MQTRNFVAGVEPNLINSHTGHHEHLTDYAKGVRLMSARLEQIKKRDRIIFEGTRWKDDIEWLIKQAEIQQETELTFSHFEELEINPDEFYGVYQDIASKHYED
ncbi:hypothetical protein J2S78_002090 [Salibacterium salarium]|nr:hypothetical protein [Salibacterium salarium]